MNVDMDSLQDFAIRYTLAWCSQDAAAVAAFFSQNGSLTINDSVPAVGRGAVTEVASNFMEAFPDLRVVMDELVVANERVEYPSNSFTVAGSHSFPQSFRFPLCSFLSRFTMMCRNRKAPHFRRLFTTAHGLKNSASELSLIGYVYRF